MSSHAPRTTNRRRSLSLNMDTRVTDSETEVTRLAILAVGADPLQCREAKLEHVPFVAQNNLADEQHARQGLGLREQLEEKDRKLSAAREGMSTLQERLIRRVGEIDAVINWRRQRTTHVAFSRPNSLKHLHRVPAPNSATTALPWTESKHQRPCAGQNMTLCLSDTLNFRRNSENVTRFSRQNVRLPGASRISSRPNLRYAHSLFRTISRRHT